MCPALAVKEDKWEESGLDREEGFFFCDVGYGTAHSRSFRARMLLIRLR